MLNNKKSRTENVKKSSAVALIDICTGIILPFAYRMLFLKLLAVEYLGLSALFTSILGALALVDFGTALNFRLYKPVMDGDIQAVGRLMNHYRHIYRCIRLFILGAGLSIMPFVRHFISSTAEIPADVNLYVIYLLYLVQTSSSYLFSYKQTLLSADQRHHIVILLHTLTLIAAYGLQSVILLKFRDFTLTLIAGIAVNLILNLLFSLFVTKEYPEVFAVKESIPKEEKTALRKDAFSSLAHRLGGYILTSTDNIILSRFAGLAAVGIYSGYSMVISSISGLIVKVFSGIVPSVGNAHYSLDNDASYTIYKRLLFFNLWISTVVTVGAYALINPFITLWLGEEMLFPKLTAGLLCAQFYLENTRQVNISYTNACGLYVKDRARPFIESVINLVSSVILVKLIGVPGVILGTIISHFTTVFWREPKILFQNEFRRPQKEYWLYYAAFTAVTVILSGAADLICAKYAGGILGWLICGLAVVTVSCFVLTALFYRSSEFRYYTKLIGKTIRQLRHKK